MIAFGGSILDTARQLRDMGARRIFVFSTFGLFTSGLKQFDEAYEAGWFDRILTTNLVYQTDELKKRPWYFSVNMDRYIAALIDSLNRGETLQELSRPAGRIKADGRAVQAECRRARPRFARCGRRFPRTVKIPEKPVPDRHEASSFFPVLRSLLLREISLHNMRVFK